MSSAHPPSQLRFSLITALLVLLTISTAGCGLFSPDSSLHIDSMYAVDDPQFARTMGHLFGPPLQDGNTIETLNNGDEIFPAMLQAIRAARRSITFETFIYWKGDIGDQFTEALC